MSIQNFSLMNKIAIVTGGGSGIGQAMCCSFAQAGAQVFVLDLSEDAGAETLHKVQELGGTATALACDISDQDAVNTVFQNIKTEAGSIDVVVNNAGIASIGTVLECSSDEMDKIYNVNIKGVYNCLQAAVAAMKENGGSIINMASIASKIGIADRFAYSMSNGAVLSMTLSIAKDFINDGIRCNCICPARIHTPFVDGYLEKNYPDSKDEKFKELSTYQPIGRMGTPDEVANLALYLASDASAFCTGSSYDIDGGVMSLI